MKSLFWKIFVSFWGALILFTGLTLGMTSHYLENARSEKNLSTPRFHLHQYINQAQRIARLEGEDHLRDWLHELDRKEAIPYLLLDEQGNDYLNRPVPAYLQKRLQRILKRLHRDDDDDEDDEEHEYKYKGHRSYDHPRPPVISIDKRPYRLLPDHRSVTLSRVLNRPRVILAPVLLAALISGVVCFLLARYLTAPIGRLRNAANKMAEGDLSQRVSESMGSREDEIVELAKDFDYMAEQLQRLIQSHKQLLRDASHELRSPLARLQVALGLARQKEDQRDERRNDEANSAELDRIELEAERLNDLIGQLLALARLEAGVGEVKFESVDLEQLINRLVDDADFEARALGCEVQLLETCQRSLRANPLLLSSALENVIRNALRYSGENTVVEIAMKQPDDKTDWIDISICDQGPGIPEAMLESIFEPFVRVGEARDRHSGGHGLGLAIAQRAVKIHGGMIQAKNRIQGGLCVVIQLPVKS